MKNTVTISDLKNALHALNVAKGFETSPYKGNTNKSNIGNFHLSRAYGGFNVHQIANEAGGVTEPSGGGHVTKRECLERINRLFY